MMSNRAPFAVVATLLAVVAGPGCDHTTPPADPLERAELMARLQIFFPQFGAPPYVTPRFCRTKDPGCVGFESLAQDPQNTRVDPWCVALPRVSQATALSAGTANLTDARGHRLSLGGPAPKTNYYDLTSVGPPTQFDLTLGLTFSVAGDTVPAFSVGVPAAPTPPGKATTSGPASRSSGLPFSWQPATPGTKLVVGLGSDATQQVYCHFSAADTTRRVSGQVVRWLADRGATTLYILLHPSSYWHGSKGTVQLDVERQQENRSTTVSIVP